MNTLISLPTGVFILSAVVLTVSSCASSPPRAQLVDGKLRPCLDRPNCVSSESDRASSRVEPLTFKDPPEKAWGDLKEAIRELGGMIREEDDGYLWATFTSKIFRFVDDVEFRIILSASMIHLRSGSRKGYSDLGVNRRRVEKLRTLFNKKRNLEVGR